MGLRENGQGMIECFFVPGTEHPVPARKLPDSAIRDYMRDAPPDSSIHEEARKRGISATPTESASVDVSADCIRECP